MHNQIVRGKKKVKRLSVCILDNLAVSSKPNAEKIKGMGVVLSTSQIMFCKAMSKMRNIHKVEVVNAELMHTP